VIGEPGDKAPNALMSVRNLSPNTVLACGVTSHDPDPDGFIIRYTFQFSDGTTITTPAAVHTASGPGSITLTVMDQFGATGSTTQSFSASSSATIATQAEQQRQSTSVQRQQFEPIRPH